MKSAYRLRSTIILLSAQFLALSPLTGMETKTPTFGQTRFGDSECVVLLHGLGHSARSMGKMEESLLNAGFSTANIDYPSREKPIGLLAHEAIPDGVATCRSQSAEKIHFVTHSMGGILVRYYLANSGIEELGRVVMLSPPNQGSEIVDKLDGLPGFAGAVGPAGLELGTNGHSVPLRLGPADFDVGIITGDRGINPLTSPMIPGEDDGKVSIESAKLEGMTDFLLVNVSHTYIMENPEVVLEVIHFLKNGKFSTSEVILPEGEKVRP
jgi:triacylglycerol lipase